MSLVGQLEIGTLDSAYADPWPDSSPSRMGARKAPEPPAAPTGGLFVATDPQWWTTHEPNIFARDNALDDVMYRRLDPDYFAWLWSRVQLVIQAFDAGRIDRPAFDTVITRWAWIYRWAIDTWGREVLDEALRTSEPRIYKPPTISSLPRLNPHYASVVFWMSRHATSGR